MVHPARSPFVASLARALLAFAAGDPQVDARPGPPRLARPSRLARLLNDSTKAEARAALDAVLLKAGSRTPEGARVLARAERFTC